MFVLVGRVITVYCFTFGATVFSIQWNYFIITLLMLVDCDVVLIVTFFFLCFWNLEKFAPDLMFFFLFLFFPSSYISSCCCSLCSCFHLLTFPFTGHWSPDAWVWVRTNKPHHSSKSDRDREPQWEWGSTEQQRRSSSSRGAQGQCCPAAAVLGKIKRVLGVSIVSAIKQ